jgi:hypothetical protein
MEHPGNSKQIAVNVVPLLVASGIMLGTPAAVIAAAAPHAAALTTIMAGLGINLVSSGLAALCKPRRLLAGREYENLVANHDILRLVRTAWGDAAASAVQNYSESHPVSTLISLFAQRPDEFLKILEAVDPEDFIPEEISASTIREAIDASRRSLASPSAQEMNSKYVKNLNSALIGAVIDAVSRKLPSDLKLPSDFRPFLAGEDPRLPGGILGQLCIYVALHLKTDTRAQVAVLHLTLQDVSDDLTDMKQAQQQIEDLCKRIYASANQSQTVLLAAFENKIKDLSANIQTQLDEAFNHSIRPQLDRPFANASADTLASFTYRFRTTPMFGREAAKDALLQFLGDPRPALWTVISGPAGTGKSRIAAELIDMVRTPTLDCQRVRIGYWRAGFLRNHLWIKDAGLRWNLDADTLIVIDYAGQLGLKDLATFLADLNRPCELSNCLLRVILIDRLPPDSDLGLATRLVSGNDRRGDILANRWHFIAKTNRSEKPEFPEEMYSSKYGEIVGSEKGKDPLALEPVTKASALQIAEAWANGRWTRAASERIQHALEKDNELARPLFAALLGHAIGNDQLSPGELNPVTVASTALAHQFRAYGPGSQWVNAKNLLVVATAGQGVAEEEIFDDSEIVCGLTGKPLWSDTDLEELRTHLRLLGGTAPGGLTPPLEPDFLGSLFVLENLLHLPSRKRAARADFLMSVAWRYGQSPGEFLSRLASDFIGRANQLARASARDGEHPFAHSVDELLICLIQSAVGDEALKRGGGEVLASAVHSASKAGETKTARRLIDALEAAYSKHAQEFDPGDLASAWFGYALADDLSEVALRNAEQALNRIRALDRRKSASVRGTLAAAFVNQSARHCSAGQLAESDTLLDELRALYHDYPETGMRESLAKALLTRSDYLPESGAPVEELRLLHHDYPDSSIRKSLALAILRRFYHFNAKDQLSESGLRVDELRQLHHDYPESTVRESLTKVLYNHYNALDAAGKLPESGSLADELRQLYRDYPEFGVSVFLAPVLSKRYLHFVGEHQQAESAELIEELYQLHLDFPSPFTLIELTDLFARSIYSAGVLGCVEHSNAGVDLLRELWFDYYGDSCDIRKVLEIVKSLGDEGASTRATLDDALNVAERRSDSDIKAGLLDELRRILPQNIASE